MITVNGATIPVSDAAPRAFPVVGIDPSSEQIGIAHVDAAGTCTRLRSIRCIEVTGATRAHALQRTVEERLRPELDLIAPNTSVYIEQPPPTAKAHVNHGHQGAIGLAVGIVIGIVMAECWRRQLHPRLVEVRDWRETMLVEAGRRKLFLSRKPSPFAPKPARTSIAAPKIVNTDGHGPGSGKVPSFDLEFPCGHRRVVGAFAEVQRLQSSGLVCASCDASEKASDDVADPTRDHWKENACRFAQLMAPSLYGQLVAEARGRAKTIQPDHRLSGVADACEGLGVAIYGHASERIDF